MIAYPGMTRWEIVIHFNLRWKEFALIPLCVCVWILNFYDILFHLIWFFYSFCSSLPFIWQKFFERNWYHFTQSLLKETISFPGDISDFLLFDSMNKKGTSVKEWQKSFFYQWSNFSESKHLRESIKIISFQFAISSFYQWRDISESKHLQESIKNVSYQFVMLKFYHTLSRWEITIFITNNCIILTCF